MSYVTDLAATLAKSGKAVESLNPLNEIAYITNNLGTSSAYAREAINFWSGKIKPADNTKPDVYQIPMVIPEQQIPVEIDPGIGTLAASYDPADYSALASSGSTISGQTIFGYLIVGLVGIVILDRLMK